MNMWFFLFNMDLNQQKYIILCASYVTVVYHVYMNLNWRFFWTVKAEMLQKSENILIDHVYPITTNFRLRFSFRLSIPNVWHLHPLCAAFSSNVGVWDIWACSLFLSLIIFRFVHPEINLEYFFSYSLQNTVTIRSNVVSL